jgi:hypothetical protein
MLKETNDKMKKAFNETEDNFKIHLDETRN